MQKTNYLLGVTALTILLTGELANAAITVTSLSSATNIAFDDTGTELGGVFFATNATYDGIAFENWTGNVTTPKAFGASGVSIVGSSSFGINRTNLAGSANQYFGITYTSNNDPGSFTISGLDIGKTYRVQYGFNDPRTTFPYSVITTLVLSDATFTTQSLSIGATGTADDFQLITANVSGTTSLQLSLPTAVNGVGALINAFSVHEVIPEPSAALLGGLGLFGLLARRRRA